MFFSDLFLEHGNTYGVWVDLGLFLFAAEHCAMPPGTLFCAPPSSTSGFFRPFVLLQVLPGRRRTAGGRQPRVRHGYHFALAAETNAFKSHPLSADLFSAATPRAVGTGEVNEALLPRSSAGVYVAHKLGLAEGKRLRSLTSACDVKWMLEDRGIRDDFSKISANALRRDILLLTPAAKAFLKNTVGDVAAWNMMKAKEFLELQEQIRTGSCEIQDAAAATIAPPLPPLPPGTPSGGNKDPAAAMPLAVDLHGGPSSKFQLDLRSIPPECRPPFSWQRYGLFLVWLYCRERGSDCSSRTARGGRQGGSSDGRGEKHGVEGEECYSSCGSGG